MGADGRGPDFGAVLKHFLHALLSIFGSGPRKVVAAVVTGRVAESVGGRRTLDFLRALHQRKIQESEDDASRRQRRFATATTLRDVGDATRRQRRFATAGYGFGGEKAGGRVAGKARTAFGMVLYYLWLRSAKIRGPRSGREADGGTDGMAGLGHDFDNVLTPFLHAVLSIFGSGALKVVDRGHDGFRFRLGGWRPKQGRLAIVAQFRHCFCMR